MSRSYKKSPFVIGKGNGKYYKQAAQGIFRARTRAAIRHQDYEACPRKHREVMDPWNYIDYRWWQVDGEWPCESDSEWRWSFKRFMRK